MDEIVRMPVEPSRRLLPQASDSSLTPLRASAFLVSMSFLPLSCAKCTSRCLPQLPRNACRQISAGFGRRLQSGEARRIFTQQSVPRFAEAARNRTDQGAEHIA